MNLEIARGSKTRDIRESEVFASSWWAGIDDENMNTLGRCACIILRRRSGRGPRESNEGHGRRSNDGVLAESEEFLVSYDADFLRGELWELLYKTSRELSIETRKELSHISPTNPSTNQHCHWVQDQECSQKNRTLEKGPRSEVGAFLLDW